MAKLELSEKRQAFVKKSRRILQRSTYKYSIEWR